jgi:hypothetical protein
MLEPTLERRDHEMIGAEDGPFNPPAVVAKPEVNAEGKLFAGSHGMVLRALSVDSHTGSDFFAFQYKP